MIDNPLHDMDSFLEDFENSDLKNKIPKKDFCLELSFLPGVLHDVVFSFMDTCFSCAAVFVLPRAINTSPCHDCEVMSCQECFPEHLRECCNGTLSCIGMLCSVCGDFMCDDCGSECRSCLKNFHLKCAPSGWDSDSYCHCFYCGTCSLFFPHKCEVCGQVLEGICEHNHNSVYKSKRHSLCG